MLGGFDWSSKQFGPTLVLEPIAFAMDAEDSRVVKDAIEHRGGEQASPAKAPFQLPKVRFDVSITMVREEVQCF